MLLKKLVVERYDKRMDCEVLKGPQKGKEDTVIEIQIL